MITTYPVFCKPVSVRMTASDPWTWIPPHFPLLPHNSGSTTPLGTERRQRLGLVVRVRVRVAVGRFCLTKLALRRIKI